MPFNNQMLPARYPEKYERDSPDMVNKDINTFTVLRAKQYGD